MREGPESQLSAGSTEPRLVTAIADSSYQEGKLSAHRVESVPHWPFDYTIFLTIVTGLLMVAMLLGVAIGSVAIPLPAIIRAIAAGFTPFVFAHAGPISGPVFTIVWLMRMPRAVMGALVGAALAVAGAQMQGLFQNPLASPDIIGVSARGSLGGVIALATGLAARSLFYLPILSFAGALIALQVVYAIATRRARTAVATLLLGGVALTFLIGASLRF